MLLDWGVVSLTLLSAGASALAATIAFRHDDTPAMAQAVLACVAAIAAGWLGRSASRAMQGWQDELVAWHGNDIALLLDETGHILDANDRAAEAYGIPLDSLALQHVRVLRHPDCPDDCPARLEEIRAHRRALYETVHRRPDGTPFPAEVSARLVEARGRKLLHFIIRDVTEAHVARERIVAAERLAAVGSVAAAMAHDINSPLCGVQGNVTFALDVLGDPVPDLAGVRTALADAQDASLRVRDLVRDLNAFANGFAEVETAADLRSVVADAVETTRGLVAHRCRVVVEVPPLPRIMAAARRLAQVFTILVRDAAKTLPEGDPAHHVIRISARALGPTKVAVEVTDDGPPIHPASAGPAVDPAFGRPQVARSTGAGLAAVMGIVRAAGGDVVTESGPGRLNTVRVILPTAVGTDERTAEPSAGRPRLGLPPGIPASSRRARLPE
jgi:PAS domain S-box-containing protein